MSLFVRLFGTLSVEDQANHVVSFRRNKTGLLLAYLALHPQQSHSRETLADLLWEEGESDTLRNRLRQELSQLRRILREQNIDDTLLLEATQNTLRICSGVGSDLQQYRSLLKNAERSQDPETKIRLLVQAAALYRAPLLADFDAPQIVTERETLAHRHAAAMTELAALQQKKGDLTAAVETMQTLLVRDPYREEVHADLMRLYAALGQPTQVLKQFQLLETALKDAFDEQPSHANRQLMQELREKASSNASGTLSATAPVREKAETEISEPPLLPVSAAADNTEAILNEWASLAISPESEEPKKADYSAEFPRPRPVPVLIRAIKRPIAAILTLIGIVGGLFVWNGIRQRNRLQPVWVAEYHAQAGEKENSEATDVATDDAGNVYVCGFTKTEDEDIDILILKYSPSGELLWRNRYTSPEHDCDRAFSLVVDRGGVFIAGETYVPESKQDKGGWRHLTVKYDTETGIEEWWKRSSANIERRDYSTRLVADGRGGVYTGSTEIKQDGTAAMQLVHYNSQGKLLWSYSTPSHSRLYDMIGIDQEGIVVCGDRSPKREGSETTAEQDALILRVSFTGKKLWQLAYTATDRNISSDNAVCLAQNPAGEIFVAGDTVLPESSPAKKAVWVAKIAREGGILWQRTFAQNGYITTPSDLVVSPDRVYLAGRMLSPDHTERLVALAYDTMGNRQWASVVTRQNAPRSTGSRSLTLLGETVIFGGTIQKPIAGGTSFEQQDALLQAVRPDGTPLWQILYDTTPSTNNAISRLAIHQDRQTGQKSLYAVGQVSSLTSTAHITLFKYQPE